MTSLEVAAYVIKRWLDDHSPTAIMLQLICLGHPLRKAEVMVIIRRYVDLATENEGYGRR